MNKLKISVLLATITAVYGSNVSAQNSDTLTIAFLEWQNTSKVLVSYNGDVYEPYNQSGYDFICKGSVNDQMIDSSKVFELNDIKLRQILKSSKLTSVLSLAPEKLKIKSKCIKVYATFAMNQCEYKNHQIRLYGIRDFQVIEDSHVASSLMLDMAKFFLIRYVYNGML